MKKEYQQNELDQIAKELIATVSSKKLCFHGEMGAGKTTLIKALVKELGGGSDVSSPTFGIVNQYNKPNGELLGYHFDFYRLNSESEALDFGLEDYLFSKGWIFMEWPEKVKSLLPEDVAHIYLQIVDDKTRSILLQNN